MRGLSRYALVPALAVTAALVGTSQAPAAAVTGETTYLVAQLAGANEVRTPSSPAGDPDGYGVHVVAITGNEVRFAMVWANIAPPSGAHIHSGITGVNGPIRVDYFSGPALPGTITAVVGRVTTPNTALLEAIKADPGAYYANVHNVQYPGGAIRGQLTKLSQKVDLDQALGTGFLRAHADGAQEVTAEGATGVGDPNGRGWAAVDASGSRVAFALKWAGIAPPTASHIHVGERGVAGDVVVPLFATPTGLPKSLQGVSGYVRNLNSALLARIRREPAGFYVNVHNEPYPAGAVRGQLQMRPASELGH